jgi:hypothetical protein
LVKRTLSPLPPSMSTLLSLEPATTGFRRVETTLVQRSLSIDPRGEKVMGTSDHQRGVGTAGSMFNTSRLVAF